MSRSDAQPTLMPSLLDRLIDPESAGTRARPGYSVEQMADAVQRDLEDLLNTRQSYEGLPEDNGEVARSILAYGFPDLTSLNAITPEQRAQIGQLLEAIVGRYEPRLRDIRVTLVEPGDGKRQTVRFRVEARMRVEPAPEVVFDTVLELTTGHYSVARGG
jgi:type VI secretion system protein ImpF